MPKTTVINVRKNELKKQGGHILVKLLTEKLAEVTTSVDDDEQTKQTEKEWNRALDKELRKVEKLMAQEEEYL